MIRFLKWLYKAKIRLMFYFGLGWNELATPIAVVRDIGVVLTVLDVLFKIRFGWKIDVLICLVSFGMFILIGFILKVSGMSDFATKLGNNINPDLKLIRKIAERLGIYE